MNEKKVVGRNVAIALGIICIIVAVGLVGPIIIGKDNTIATKDSLIQILTSQKNQLQTWLDGNKTLLNQTQTWLDGNITYYNSQINSLNSQITSLQNQVNDLTDITNLAKSTVWVNDQTVSQPANSYTHWTCSASYAGYVSVWVQTSSATDTRVRVIYSSHGVDYDDEIGVGSSGTAVFPLLPSSNIEIRVGNHNLVSGATETVTITYYY